MDELLGVRAREPDAVELVVARQEPALVAARAGAVGRVSDADVLDAHAALLGEAEREAALRTKDPGRRVGGRGAGRGTSRRCAVGRVVAAGGVALHVAGAG